jgi:type IV pilus assembly protein PilO
MINLQQGSGKQGAELGANTLKRVWFWTPIAGAGLLSVGLLLAVALPQALEIGRVLRHLQELEGQSQELELLKLELLRSQKDRQRVERQGEQLTQLVTGRGDVATFLATLDIEANQSRVKLQLYEPLAPGGKTPAGQRTPGAPGAPPPPSAPPPAGAPGASAPSAAPPPSAGPGKAPLRERSLVLVASGTYPQLLDFLRRMEALEVLVEQKDLTLTVAEDKPGAGGSALPPAVPRVEARLSLTLWAKDGKHEEKKPPAGTAPLAPRPPAAPG